MVLQFPSRNPNNLTVPEDVPPHNVEAEEAILGAILLDPNAIYKVAHLPAETFWIESHQKIYKSCLEVHREGLFPDLTTVASYLFDTGSLDKVGGQGKLAQLIDRTVSAVNIDQYANLLLRKYLSRILIKAGHEIIELGYSPFPRSPEEITKESTAILEDSFAAASILPPAIEKYKLRDKNTLDLDDFLPAKYSKPLKQLAKYYPCPEEICLHNLWAPVASIINPETNILVRELNGRPEFPIVRTMLVAESSNRKSDIERTFLEPVEQIQKDWDKKYQEEVKEYNFALSEWEALTIDEKKKRQSEEPIPPVRRFFVYTEGTKEGVRDILSKQPGHAILWAPDEILAAKTSQGEYKGGRGSDQETNLSSFNGGTRTTIRQGKVVKVKDSSSLMGGIQPMALPSFIKDIEDYRGEFARYLPLVFDTQPFIVKDDFPINLSPLLKGLYEQIIDFPAQDFIFSSRAKRIYVAWQNSMEIRRYKHPSAGARAFLGKIQGYCAKIAMELHLIWEAADGQRTPAREIPDDKVEKAIRIVDFYIEQYFKIRRLMGLESKDPIKDLIFERLKILGTVTRSNLTSASRVFRNMKDSEVLRHFREIADANPGTIALERSGRGGAMRLRLLREDIDELNYSPGFYESEEADVKVDAETYATVDAEASPPPASNTKTESDRFYRSQSNLDKLDTPVKVSNPGTVSDSGDSLTLDTQNQISEISDRTEDESSPLDAADEDVQSVGFKVGDRVVVNTPKLKSHDKLGTVTEIKKQNASLVVYVKRDDDDEGFAFPYAANELRLVETPVYACGNPAQVGDRVREGKSSLGTNIAMRYLKLGDPKTTFWVWKVTVAWDRGVERDESIEFLELVMPDDDNDGGTEPEPPTPDDSEGDRTEVGDNSEIGQSSLEGDRTSTPEPDENSDLQSLPFNVGDRVRVSCRDMVPFGRFGEVVEINRRKKMSNSTFRVRFDDGTFCPFLAIELEAAATEQPTESDRTEVTDNSEISQSLLGGDRAALNWHTKHWDGAKTFEADHIFKHHPGFWCEYRPNPELDNCKFSFYPDLETVGKVELFCEIVDRDQAASYASPEVAAAYLLHYWIGNQAPTSEQVAQQPTTTDDKSSDRTDKEPAAPLAPLFLSGRQLAKRLGVSAAMIPEKKDSEDFWVWCKKRDPQALGWKFSDKNKFESEHLSHSPVNVGDKVRCRKTGQVGIVKEFKFPESPTLCDTNSDSIGEFRLAQLELFSDFLSRLKVGDKLFPLNHPDHQEINKRLRKNRIGTIDSRHNPSSPRALVMTEKGIENFNLEAVEVVG